MHRRAALASLGTAVTGLLAGCIGPFSGESESNPPRLVGLVVGNWHPEPQTLHLHIDADEDRLYEKQVQLPGGNPSEYDRPSRTLDDHPAEIPSSAVLSTRLDTTPDGDSTTLDLGAHPYDECIGVQIEICADCERQKGQTDVTVPADPELLVLTTSNCRYPGG